MDHEEWVEKKRQELVTIAQSMINETINLVEGCHMLYDLKDFVEAPNNRVFSEVVLVVSDTDHLPLLEARKHCDPEYLKRVDHEIEAYLKDMAPTIMKACQKIINSFSQEDNRK